MPRRGRLLSGGWFAKRSEEPEEASRCAHCGTSTSKRCGRCRAEYFCSQRCADLAWPMHHPICGRREDSAPLLWLPICVLSSLLELPASKLPVRTFLVLRCVNRLVCKAASLGCRRLSLRKVQTASQLECVSSAFPALRELELTRSRQLEISELPVHLLSNLTALHASNMPHLPGSVVASLSGCAQLQLLELRGCPQLDEVACAAIGSHRSLTEVDVSHCVNLNGTAAQHLINLWELRRLDISRCSISCLPARTDAAPCKLERIAAADCTNLITAPILQQAAELTDLDLSACWQLQPHELAAALGSLKVLELNNCNWVRAELLHRHTGLRRLGVSHNPTLSQLNLQQFEALESLSAASCRDLTDSTLLSLLTQRSLTQLNIAGCHGLSEAAVVAVCRANPIRALSLSGCRHLGDRCVVDLVACCGNTLIELELSGLPLTEQTKAAIENGARLAKFIWRDGKQVQVHGFDQRCICSVCAAERARRQLPLLVSDTRSSAHRKSAC